MFQGSFPKSFSQQEVEGGETVRFSDKATIPPSSGSENKDTESDKLVEDLLRRVARDVSVRRHGGNEGDDSPDSRRKTLTRDKVESNDEDTRHYGQRRRHRHQENTPYGYNRLRHESYLKTRSTRDLEAQDESSRSQERRPIDTKASHPDDVPAAVDRVAAALANGRPRIAGGGRPHDKAAASSITDPGVDPFTEVMWEDSSCRQVLQAMFFGPDSAIPAGRSEEYKELEG